MASKRLVKQSNKKAKARLTHLTMLTFIVLVIKLILVARSNQSTWLGADGESFINNAGIISNEGFFSSNGSLMYFAGGYSFLLFLFNIFGTAALPYVTILFQTVSYSFAVWVLARQLLKLPVSAIAIPFAYISLLNPTLSLSSLQIGYESPVAAIYIAVVALLLRDLSQESLKKLKWPFLLGSGLLGFAAFLQPKFILSSLAVLIIWVIARKPSKATALVIALSILSFTVLPASLSIRSQIAVGSWIPASSLGTVAAFGAGPNATGHGSTDTGLICDTTGLSPESASNAKFKCAVKWYLTNPIPAVELIASKSIMFWSPWAGPLAEGSQGRNLYTRFHPVLEMSQSQEGYNFIAGPFGRFLAWAWLLGGLFVLFLGFYSLWKANRVTRALGSSAMAIVLASWLIAAGTQGDHRYRVPIMGMSLLLQISGWNFILKKARISS
jgi:hypothetical protein